MDNLQLCRRNRRRRSWLKATYTHIYGWTEKSLSPKIFFGKILHKQPSEMGERSLDFDANGSAALLRNHNILFLDHIMRANMCVLSDCFIFLGLLWSPVPEKPSMRCIGGFSTMLALAGKWSCCHSEVTVWWSLLRKCFRKTSLILWWNMCIPVGILLFSQVRYEHSISLPFRGFSTNQELSEQVLCLLLL